MHPAGMLGSEETIRPALSYRTVLIPHVISPVSLLSQPRSKMDAPGTSSTVWLTKAVDISVSYPVHVVVYTVPSLRRPPVLLVCHGAMRGGKLQVLMC